MGTGDKRRTIPGRWNCAAKDRQRQGYAKEATIAVRDWTFRHTPFNMVYSYMKAANTPSCKTAMTYGEIAAKIAVQKGLKQMSAQAVGGAVGHNPISLMIPCHRVVGANGSLTGYGGGIDRKVKLLQLERADMQGLFVPQKGTAL